MIPRNNPPQGSQPSGMSNSLLVQGKDQKKSTLNTETGSPYSTRQQQPHLPPIELKLETVKIRPKTKKELKKAPTPLITEDQFAPTHAHPVSLASFYSSVSPLPPNTQLPPIALQFKPVVSHCPLKKKSKRQTSDLILTVPNEPIGEHSSLTDRLKLLPPIRTMLPQENKPNAAELQAQTAAVLEFLKRPNAVLEVFRDSASEFYAPLSQIHNVNERVMMATLMADNLWHNPDIHLQLLKTLQDSVAILNARTQPSESFNQQEWVKQVQHLVSNKRYHDPTLYGLPPANPFKDV